MPRDGSGNYSLPAGTQATTGTTIESAKYNSFIEDVEQDLNDPRPVSAGGTGAASKSAARDELEVSGKVTSQGGAYTALAGDRSKLIRFTADATLTLTAAATLADGWFVEVQADGGAVTIDPNGAETINGAATFALADGESVQLRCNGTSFFATSISRVPADETTVISLGGGGTISIDSTYNQALAQTGDGLTLSLDAPATLGNGFWFDVEALGTVVIDGDGALVNGAATITLLPGEFARVYCNGAAFTARITPAQPTIINITSSTAVDAYDVPTGATGFILKVESFIPVTANSTLCLQYGTNGSGGAFTTSSNYFTVGGNSRSSSSTTDAFTTTSTVAFIGRATSDTAAFGNSGISRVECFGLNNASGSPKLLVETYGNSTTENVRSSYAGRMTGISITDVDAVRFLADTGNMAELKATLTWVRGVA